MLPLQILLWCLAVAAATIAVVVVYAVILVLYEKTQEARRRNRAVDGVQEALAKLRGEHPTTRFGRGGQ